MINIVDLESQVEAIFAAMIKNPAVAEALDMLDALPSNLTYHGKSHTLDVLHETILFALVDEAEPEIIELESIAAAWHDVGYLQQYNNNEPVAVEMFKVSRAWENLSDVWRDEIVANILDTQIVLQNGAPCLLRQRSKFGYVLDADVSNFGRDDYFSNRIKIMTELKLDDAAVNDFCIFGMKLLQNHNWHTAAAKKLRQAQKNINLKILEEKHNK